MICAVHQPNFLPYPGFFHKYLVSDVFVLYDTAQFSRTGFHHRNRIKTPRGVSWLTVPVHIRSGVAIRDVRVAGTAFVKSHLRGIEHNYARSPHFEPVFARIEAAYRSQTSLSLVEWNARLLEACFDLLGKSTRVVLASDLKLDAEARASEALAAIVGAVGATTYLSGPGGRAYLDERPFAARGLNVAWQDYRSLVYDQLWEGFAPNLSTLDGLFNVGPDRLRKMLLSNRPEPSDVGPGPAAAPRERPTTECLIISRQ